MDFSISEKVGFYKAVYSRRDVRGQFNGEEIPEETLARILYAAHHAPSVGFMQPWNFIIIRDMSIRKKIYESFLRENSQAELMFSEEKREKYRSLKLEGILESSLNICVTCDRSRFGPVVLGRTSDMNMDLFSTVCAVQNMWLAARTEEIGMGWVSILSIEDVKNILCLPESVVPIAYLCLGPVSDFPKKPELEEKKWLARVPLADLIYVDHWKKCMSQTWKKLDTAIKQFNIQEQK